MTLSVFHSSNRLQCVDHPSVHPKEGRGPGKERGEMEKDPKVHLTEVQYLIFHPLVFPVCTDTTLSPSGDSSKVKMTNELFPEMERQESKGNVSNPFPYLRLIRPTQFSCLRKSYINRPRPDRDVQNVEYTSPQPLQVGPRAGCTVVGSRNDCWYVIGVRRP